MNRREIALKILCAELANPNLFSSIKEKHYILYIKEAYELADKFMKHSPEEPRGPFEKPW